MNSSYVPVIAIGFDDVQKRVEAQKKQSMAQLEKIKVCSVMTSSR